MLPQGEIAAAGLTWILDTFATPFIEHLKGRTKDKWRTFDWANAEQAYRAKLLDLHGKIRILGNPDEVQLEGIFTDVYILDKPTAYLRYNINELRSRNTNRFDFSYQPQNRINGLKLVQQGKNLYILGKPGAGKTTFLKFITIQAALGKLERTPIFISLNDLAASITNWDALFKSSQEQIEAQRGSQKSLRSSFNADPLFNNLLVAFIVYQFEICDFPNATEFIKWMLKKGKAIILFDGLDEVKQENEQRRTLTRLLQDFTKQYNKNQFLLTCRIAANEYAFQGFRDLEIADFTRDQIHTYVQKWFGKDVKKSQSLLAELYKEENEGLRELCSTPLLLAMLCLSFGESMSFPPRRVELYEEAFYALLRKWDSERSIQRDDIYRGLSYKRKQQMLSHIATPAFDKGEYYFDKFNLEKQIIAYLHLLKESSPVEEIDGEVVLKAIEAQYGLLVERAKNVYSFSHLTFQEYLTAKYIIENEARGRVKKLIPYVTDNRWREVFLLTASLLDNTDEFFKDMCQVIDQLLVNDLILRELVTWSSDKAIKTNVSKDRLFVTRLTYCVLTLVPNLNQVTAETRASFLTSARNLARSQNLEHQFDVAITVENEWDGVITSARTIDRKLSEDRTIFKTANIPRLQTIGLSKACGFSTALDFALLYVWKFASFFAKAWYLHELQDYTTFCLTLYQHVLALSEQRDKEDKTFDYLTRALAAIHIPEAVTIREEWQIFATALYNIIVARNLDHEWRLDEKQISMLKDYFIATELLVQCLNLAVASNRQTILTNLLLPPQS